MKQVPNSVLTNIRRRRKKCSRRGYLKTGICAPLASVPYRITFRLKWGLKLHALYSRHFMVVSTSI